MLPRILVRPFRAPDMDRILEIEVACFGADAYDRNLFAQLARQCGSLFLVAGRGRSMGGYMVTCMRGTKAPGRAELVSIGVDPRFRRVGVASSLMKSTLRRLRLQGASRISLMVRVSNGTARRFYERHGFQKLRTEARYYEDGEDAVLMSLLLE
jgi:[ribosomal protein S18]-alanine N-acetyltransferase